MLSGIPGKMGTNGEDVPNMFLDGKLKEIVSYNEYDALTTYLLWLRTAFFSGRFNEKQYKDEQEILREHLEKWSKKEEGEHLGEYIKEWDRLRGLTE